MSAPGEVWDEYPDDAPVSPENAPDGPEPVQCPLPDAEAERAADRILSLSLVDYASKVKIRRSQIT